MTDTQPPEAAQEPTADRAPVSPAETRRQSAARHLRHVRLYTGAFAFVALIVVLIILISANTRRVKVSWAFGSTHASLVWIILAAAVVGWLLGLATSTTFHLRTRRPR
jgi:uncharacterized integral membrane protein